MKKILIILIIPFILSGCYDYNELNDLAIISGVGIDYEESKYIVTFEVMSTKKEGETSGATSSYNISASGKTLVEAFNNNGNHMDKIPYFEHTEVVVISEEVAKEHLEEVAEYIIRSSKFRNEVYLSIAKDVKAKELISKTSEEKPVASTFISDLLEHNKKSSSASYYNLFTESLNNILTQGEDAIMPVFTLKDEEITLMGVGIFKDFKLVDILDIKESQILNLLNNFPAQTVLFEDTCGKDKIIISIYESDISINPNNQNTLITGHLSARINENNCAYDLKDIKTYEILEKKFTNIIEHKLDDIITILKNKESNALKIGKNYYNKYHKPLYFLWTNQEFIYKIDLKINKKGLIFEVKE